MRRGWSRHGDGSSAYTSLIRYSNRPPPRSALRSLPPFARHLLRFFPRRLSFSVLLILLLVSLAALIPIAYLVLQAQQQSNSQSNEIREQTDRPDRSAGMEGDITASVDSAAARERSALASSEGGEGVSGRMANESESELLWAREIAHAGIQVNVSAEVCGRLLRSPPMVCAHGGDSATAPPNTMAAFASALSLSVDAVEVDASLTSDGVLVALHDRDLRAITGLQSASVGSLRLQEIQSLDATSAAPESVQPTWQRPLKVPTLLSSLQALLGQVASITVDVKASPLSSPLSARDIAAKVAQVVQEAGCIPTCMVWGKWDDVMAHLNDINPGIRTGYTVMRDSETGQVQDLLRMSAPHVIGVAQQLISHQLVTQAHEASKEVHAWTVDDLPSMHRMLAAGVDAIVTGQPKRLQLAIREHQRMCREEQQQQRQ